MLLTNKLFLIKCCSGIKKTKHSRECCDKKLGCKSVWHVCIEETVLFKVSKFFFRKGKMTAYMCEYMESEKVRGHPI